MAVNYTGDRTQTRAPSAIPASDVSPVVVRPADGEALNTASIDQSIKVLADFVDWLTHHGMWFDTAARTVTVGHTFNGAAGDTNAAFTTTAAITNRKLLWDINAGTQRFAVYKTDGALELVSGATWGGATWTKDATNFAHKFQLTDQALSCFHVDGTIASPFVDGAWLQRVLTNDTGDLTIADAFTATAGNITATAGDVVATAGDVIATAGHLKAGASVVGTGTEGVTAAPWCSTAAAGEMHKELAPVAWAIVAANGDLTKGANVYQITQVATGHYQIVLNSAQTFGCAVVTRHDTTYQTAANRIDYTVNYGTSGGRLAIDVYSKNINVSGDPTTTIDADSQFMIVVFGA